MIWIFACIAILGYELNIRNKKIESYITWLVSNSLWGLYSFTKQEYALMIMFVIYDLYCIRGIIKQVKNNNLKRRKWSLRDALMQNRTI